MKFGPVIDTAAYVFVLLFSWRILKEKISRGKIIGNLIIILGILDLYLMIHIKTAIACCQLLCFSVLPAFFYFLRLFATDTVVYTPSASNV